MSDAKNSLFARLKSDVHFRIKFVLCVSLCCNGIYSGFLVLLGKIYLSNWFFSIAIYYGLLFLVRLTLFLYVKPNCSNMSKLKTMRFSGCFLLLINLVVSTMMFILANGYHQVQYHTITVIAIATYTFGSLIIVIISNFKHFKKYNQIYFCIKIISLASASVSLVTLTNVMLSTFGANNHLLRSIVMPLLSGVVALFITASAIFVIYKSNLLLKKIKNEKQQKV